MEGALHQGSDVSESFTAVMFVHPLGYASGVVSVLLASRGRSGLAPAMGAESLQEALHTGLYRFRKMGCGYSVKHIVTGEQAGLPDRHEWQLALDGSRMYVFVSPTADPRWCADLLKTSLREHNGRIKVFGGGVLGDDGEMNIWLEEEAAGHLGGLVHSGLFAREGVGHAVEALHPCLPRAGARVFWELRRVAEFVAHNMADKAEWLRKGLRRSWAPGLETQYCAPQTHSMSGHSGARGGIDLTGVHARAPVLAAPWRCCRL